ncbi:MAG: 4-hydroxy-3-methylbut-2-enyl diphosphate reductase, partial [Clostridia bacterium]|nr:4-hydroxy-3-methylbut-2-enyl diphosphate reductase [Clostridia bacterium]
MSEKITVAKHAGFCFGVKRATETIEAEIGKGGTRIYTLGHLIHNPIYLRRLEERGVRSVTMEEMDGIAASATGESPVALFLRAHGVPREVEAHLIELSEKYPYFTFVDCTCPYVKKIHKIAAECDPKEHIFVLLDDKKHPEVIGIMSYFDGVKCVFASAQELESSFCQCDMGDLHKKTPVFAAQTTYNLSEWKKTQKIIEKLYTKSIIFDTICNVTEKRQAEVKALSKTCDAMIVIGGKESSNTAKLASICREHCDNTFMIESASELTSFLPNTHKKVGIVAGASTPSDIIEEVFK